MHIHGFSPSNYVAQLYAAGNDSRPLEAQRAAETRKKLARAAQAADASATPEEAVLISHWLDGSQPPRNPYAAAPPRDTDFD